MIHVLCYHRILEEKHLADEPYFRRGTALLASDFARQLDYLCTHFRMVDEREVSQWLKSPGRPWPHTRHGCWITFDDGYADNLEVAAPLLKQVDVKPSLFISTAVLATGWQFPVDAWYAAINSATCAGWLDGFDLKPWWCDPGDPACRERLVSGPEKQAYLLADESRREQLLSALEETLGARRSKPPRYLSVPELHALCDLGWSIGGHTHTHAFLTEFSEEDWQAEFLHSQDLLRRIIPESRRSSFFAYPDGRWNRIVRARLERMDTSLHGALTIEPGVVEGECHAFSLKRHMICTKTLPTELLQSD